LAIAVLFGFIIAEPVVLWVFRDAIEEHILDERSEEVALTTTRLVECNPEDDIALAAELANSSDCEGYIVDRLIPAPLESVMQSPQIAQLEAELATLTERLVPVETRLTDARDRYQREIRGEDSNDTSGNRGLGPIALAIEAEIDELEGERDRILNERQLVNNSLAALLDSFSGEQADQVDSQRRQQVQYESDTRAAIEKRIAESEERNDDSIGLLQRFDALSDLTASHGHILVARWLLTGFLLAVDSMPVIAKLMGGKTSYDLIYSNSLALAERRARQLDQFAEQDHVKRIELAKFRRGLERTVARKRSVVEATKSLMGLDDELEDVHRQRNLHWERRAWEFAESEMGFRPSSSTRPASTGYASADPSPPGAWESSNGGSHSAGRALEGSRMPEDYSSGEGQVIDLRNGSDAPGILPEQQEDRIVAKSRAEHTPGRAAESSRAEVLSRETLAGRSEAANRAKPRTTVTGPPTPDEHWLAELRRKDSE
jgi:hypothetical protein